MDPVSDSDSLAARGAAIFDSLRSQESAEPEESAGESDDPGAVPSETESSDDETSTNAEVTDPSDETSSEPPHGAESDHDTEAQPNTDQVEADPVKTDGVEPTDTVPDPSPEPVEEAGTPATPRAPTMPDDALEAPGSSGLPGLEHVTELVTATHARRDDAAAEDGSGRVDQAGHRLPRILAVANQKGGVGKTTTAVNLGAALAEAGYRTLVVDLDPQGNASTGLGINIRDLQLSMYDVVIHEASIDDTIEATAMRNLFVAPASLDLAGAEIELVPAFSRELRLRHALEEVHDDYDYVLIDCPPSLGLLTVNGLAAAAEVLVPIQCEYYALEGLGQLLRNVALVQRNLNQRLEVSTFVCVMYDARTKLADQVVSEVRSHFGEKVCRIVVPRTVRLSEAPSYGQPILAFDPRSRGAIAYRELARELSGGPRDDTDA